MSNNNNHQQQQHHPMGIYNQLPRPAASSRMKATAGEIVEVQGGHIVRSTGRKDRHSKVCTSKGPRDRRVRLSAHTAIQFYDVQDRLGYDRPSKAVDWLIKNAKAAIDELAELPPWQPSTTPLTTAAIAATNVPVVDREMGGKNAVSPPMGAGYNYTGSDLLPPSLESDAIADTIKYFFPIAAGPTASSSNYPSDLASCHGTQNQDLRLSLQSFQDPILIHSQSATSAPMSFDASWSQQNQQRMVHWNLGGGGGDIFNMAAAQQHEHPAAVQPSHAVPLHQLLMQGAAMTQRGPLQSNSPQAFRTWMDPTAAAIHHAEFPGFASGNFSGFRIPARIQGDEEHAGLRGKPSSSNSLPSRR